MSQSCNRHVIRANLNRGSDANDSCKVKSMPERKFPQRVVLVVDVFFLFSFFAPLGPLGLNIVRHFPKKCGNAAMPRSGKNTVK